MQWVQGQPRNEGSPPQYFPRWFQCIVKIEIYWPIWCYRWVRASHTWKMRCSNQDQVVGALLEKISRIGQLGPNQPLQHMWNQPCRERLVVRRIFYLCMLFGGLVNWRKIEMYVIFNGKNLCESFSLFSVFLMVRMLRRHLKKVICICHMVLSAPHPLLVAPNFLF